MAKILVVDDDWMQRMLLQRLLVHNGYEVIEAESGEECIEKVQKDNYDAVIIDFNLPDLQGDAVARTLREIPYKGIIIVITGETSPTTQDLCKAAGVDEYYVKPFDQDALVEQLAAKVA